MWFYTLIGDTVVPALIAFYGWRYMRGKYPKRKKGSAGYRTIQSSRTEETWQFAHSLCGKIWFFGGIAMEVVALIVLLTRLQKDVKTIITTGIIVLLIQMGLVLLTAIPIEIGLFITFDRTGTRR